MRALLLSSKTVLLTWAGSKDVNFKAVASSTRRPRVGIRTLMDAERLPYSTSPVDRVIDDCNWDFQMSGKPPNIRIYPVRDRAPLASRSGSLPNWPQKAASMTRKVCSKGVQCYASRHQPLYIAKVLGHPRLQVLLGVSDVNLVAIKISSLFAIEM